MKVLNVKKHPYNGESGIYIGRENKTFGFQCSKWHNPDVLEDESLRDMSLVLYENYIRETSALWNALEELDGLNLYCWCSPKKCHGDVLIKLLNEKKLNILLSGN